MLQPHWHSYRLTKCLFCFALCHSTPGQSYHDILLLQYDVLPFSLLIQLIAYPKTQATICQYPTCTLLQCSWPSAVIFCWSWNLWAFELGHNLQKFYQLLTQDLLLSWLSPVSWRYWAWVSCLIWSFVLTWSLSNNLSSGWTLPSSVYLCTTFVLIGITQMWVQNLDVWHWVKCLLHISDLIWFPNAEWTARIQSVLVQRWPCNNSQKQLLFLYLHLLLTIHSLRIKG